MKYFDYEISTFCCILTTIIIMVSIQRCIYTTYSNSVKYKTQADSVVQVRTVLLTPCFGSSTWRVKHNSYNADHTIWPLKCTVHLVVFKISVCKDPKKTTTTSSTAQSHLQLNGRELNSRPTCQPSTDSFQNPQILFRAWRHPYSSLFPVWEFIMKMAIAISFAREHKTVPHIYASNSNSSKPNQTEW